jgi:hypothetical protein
MPLNTFASFRYRPAITADELRKIKTSDHRLYHPVKEMQPAVIIDNKSTATLQTAKS